MRAGAIGEQVRAGVAACKDTLQRLTAVETVKYSRVPGGSIAGGGGEVKTVDELKRQARVLDEHIMRGRPRHVGPVQHRESQAFIDLTLERGMQGWYDDMDASIENARGQISGRHFLELQLWLGLTILGCTLGVTLLADTPENTTKHLNPWVSFFVDTCIYGVYMMVLPNLLHMVKHQYAHRRIPSASSPSEVTESEHLKNLSDLQKYRDENSQLYQHKYIHIQNRWNEEHITYDIWKQYISMKICQAYDSKMTKTAVLSLLPLLMAKMPLATEETGSFRGGNFMWEVAASWTVLMFHDAIRKKLITPLAWLAARASYLVFYAGRWSAERLCFNTGCIKTDMPHSAAVTAADVRAREMEEGLHLSVYNGSSYGTAAETGEGKDADGDDAANGSRPTSPSAML